MKSTRWLMLLCLFGAIALFMMAPMDTPGMGLNEVDTPVAVSHPRLPQVKLTPPTIASHRVAEEISLLRLTRLAAAFRFEQKNYSVRAGDLQNLLCVFLI